MRPTGTWRICGCASTVFVIVVALAGCVARPAPAPPVSATPTSAVGDSFSTFALPSNPDPARYAPQVRTYAAAASVDTILLMAILYNEDYKPHDPKFERAWQQMNPDAAFGIANMHQAAFDDVKQGRDFASRNWQDLPDDPALAVEAAAWYLHDLAGRIPAHNKSHYTTTDLLAIGYNAGPTTMIAIANGAHASSDVQSYLDTLHNNWAKASAAVAVR
jgi:Transglycosylase SLT domain